MSQVVKAMITWFVDVLVIAQQLTNYILAFKLYELSLWPHKCFMFIDSPHSFVLPLFSLSIERRVKLTDGKVKGLMETSCKNGYYNIPLHQERLKTNVS